MEIFQKGLYIGNHISSTRTDPNQVKFKRLLANIRNANPTEDDWNLLMSRTDANMDGTESNTFSSAIHLFPTNSLVNVHNRSMLKSLGIPIARCVAEHTKNKDFSDADDDQLQQEVLLCPGQ